MSWYALALVGPDRPGIVAGATAALAELKCSLEDVSTTILRGHFAMVMVLTAPPQASARTLRDAVENRLAGFDVNVEVWPADAAPAPVAATHVLTAHGEDRIGIVAGLSGVLADAGVNICEMACLVDDAGDLRVAGPVPLARGLEVAEDLVATMRALPRCVGLAAPQIGEPVRVAVVDVTGHAA